MNTLSDKKTGNKQDSQFSTFSSKSNDILVKGARVHNLKNISVAFPRNKLIVVTGVSGSGKSSLTMDTLFAEGQRRYAESLSAYARQFMQRMVKPDVDSIKGLCPAIAIEQKVITRTPRSTVGTMTEIYDYLRLLFARIGKTISPISREEVKKDDVQDVLSFIKKLPKDSRVMILSAFQLHQNREIREELSILMQKGFARLYHHQKEGEILRIEDLLEKSPNDINKNISFKKGLEYFLLIDRYITGDMTEEVLHRLADSVSTAFYEGNGEMFIVVNGTLKHFSNKFEKDGIVFEEPSPNLFSFNNPFGACPTCEGFSQVLGISEDLVIPNRALSVYDGAVAPWKGEKLGLWKDYFIKNARKENFPVHKPIHDLSPEQYDLLWKGKGGLHGIHDFFKEVEQNLYKVQYRVLLSRYRGRTNCPECNGYRLRKEALYVKIGGKHIGELCRMPAKDFYLWLNDFQPNETDATIARRILIELFQRLQTLLDVGLGYLTMERLANSLSGGESQRIQLTRSLGSNLTNSLYILDEPSIGLHSRDTQNLIQVLIKLRDKKNTVVVVEHDDLMMREADHIIDMGPLAAHLGGEVIASGTVSEIMVNPQSLTGKYLSGASEVWVDHPFREYKKYICIENASHHNLKNVTVSFPLNMLCVVSGVSGSGKTSLVRQILYPAMKKLLGDFTETPGYFRMLSGDFKEITHVELVDQNPIGKSSRSNPVTYIKAYDAIRELFSQQPLAKKNGYLPKHFSFNVDGGRCDTCKGEGEQLVEMQFLADVHLTCETCKGRRFKEDVLEVTYHSKNIYDVLEMSVDEAILFFKDQPALAKSLQTLQDTGLGYIKLGQSSNTLSGGEAQRVKLASFLGKGKMNEKILFIFDEPTTGLHFHDIHKLLKSFNALIEQGHSIIVIEHNIDIIKNADWVIDLGPEAGDDGGEIIFSGRPAELKNVQRSHTAKFL
ncbi:MAG: excinuclease ABC subunit UvrA [Bacteroidetes bacterium]|nr:excinuclease ABC subunit UvrA [Bacteroidota bacterium]